MKLSRFALFAWAVLVYNIGVILWGAFVRATGSGAGCGSHWPLCNGEVLPRAPEIETIVEFTHRATSGVALLLTVGLLVWAFRAYAKGHSVRRGAVFSMVFMILEALLGAGLVLFELVAHNASVTRVFSMAAHLLNTFLLLAALTLTAWWATFGGRIRLRGQGTLGWGMITGLILMIFLGMSGAVTALGDTLSLGRNLRGEGPPPPTELVELLVQLRFIHPALAFGVGAYIAMAAWIAVRQRPSPMANRLAWGVTGLFVVQLIAGGVNVWLQVPVWMQLVHLLLADLIWMNWVALGAVVLNEQTAEAEVPAPRPSYSPQPG